jgi:hypothetical protein
MRRVSDAFLFPFVP